MEPATKIKRSRVSKKKTKAESLLNISFTLPETVGAIVPETVGAIVPKKRIYKKKKINLVQMTDNKQYENKQNENKLNENQRNESDNTDTDKITGIQTEITTEIYIEPICESEDNKYNVMNIDAIQYMNQYVTDNSVSLILTDPPYIISKDTGMDKYYNTVNENVDKLSKTHMDWDIFVKENESKGLVLGELQKLNFLKYGSIYGTKYCIQTNYGNWDKDFTIDKLDETVATFYKKLRVGGTVIIFFDIWKITLLKEILEKNKFKQIRFIEWIKTNAVPINSSVNYLSNAREVALVAVKAGNPTFNSKYDKGIYEYPIQSGSTRFHPTQKNLQLFKDLIKKHSNENDLVLDPFLGSGTTLFGCIDTNRRFMGSEINPEYFKKISARISQK